MGEANKRGTKEERIKAAIERDNAIALERSRQQQMQPQKGLKKSAIVRMGVSILYAYVLNTTFYDDDHDYLRRSYYGPEP